MTLKVIAVCCQCMLVMLDCWHVHSVSLPCVRSAAISNSALTSRPIVVSVEPRSHCVYLDRLDKPTQLTAIVCAWFMFKSICSLYRDVFHRPTRVMPCQCYWSVLHSVYHGRPLAWQGGTCTSPPDPTGGLPSFRPPHCSPGP